MNYFLTRVRKERALLNDNQPKAILCLAKVGISDTVAVQSATFPSPSASTQLLDEETRYIRRISWRGDAIGIDNSRDRY